MKTATSRRRKFGIFFALVAIAFVTVCGLLIAKMRERQDFVSKTVMGYRCRFTYPLHWQADRVSSTEAGKAREVYTFTPNPSPIREWIAVHLFHQAPTAPGLLWVANARPAFMMEVSTPQTANEDVVIRAGYPEPSMPSNTPSVVTMRLFSDRHLHIDGCPATVFRCEVAASGMNFYEVDLLVYQPETKTLFSVGGCGGDQYSGQVDREVEAIVSSFHVERVERAALPGDGKR